MTLLAPRRSSCDRGSGLECTGSRPRPSARMSPWARLVTASAVLVLGSAIALVIWGLASQQRRVVSYDVRGALGGVSLDLGGANVTIAGAGRRTSVGVVRTDRYAFGHH